VSPTAPPAAPTAVQPTATPADDLGAAALCVAGIHAMASAERHAFDGLVHPLAVNREAVDEPPACRVPGPDGFYATALWLRAAFADLAFDVHDVVQQGDVVAVHVTMRGRHTGDFVGHRPDGSVGDVFPPTGKRFATFQTHWFRMRDGLVVEHWANRDDLGTARQLGWVPPTPRYLARMARARRRARRAARR
jgi:predicted ester cyclase